MNAGTTASEFRTLDDDGNLRDGNVNAYYVGDLKLRVSVARVGAKLLAFDDIYEGCPLSVLRGPAKLALRTYEAREQDGRIQVRL